MTWKQPSKTKEPENLEKAYEYAVFLLSLHLRTVGEVMAKMQQRGYAEVVIQKTIDSLKEQRYLDDQRYAEIFLENLKQYKNFGFYGIKKKFMEKKLPTKIIESVLAAGLDAKEEQKIAERFLNREGFEVKELSHDDNSEVSYKSFNEEQSKQKSKIANKLKSRGFRGEVISKLMF
jgi:regulatory protein